MSADNSPALPTFEQAGRFALLVGVRTPEAWAAYVEGKSREDLFEQVLAVLNRRVIQLES